MSYSIIGSGNVGTALARQFARSGIAVSIANTRGPESIIDLAQELGDVVTATTLNEALDADIVIFAVPFAAHQALAQARATWHGKIVIDAMNAREELGGLQSTDAVALLLPGAKVVKTFNQLPAALLASVPTQDGGRRVMFVAGNDEGANIAIAALIESLGFAPIILGKIAESGSLLRYRGPLVLQNLIKQNI
ncbi:cyclohexadienyl dehydrogenase [Serratia plymuthica]|nr:cyclohexadienyl dehydrogenase [Serratia plymuthica]